MGEKRVKLTLAALDIFNRELVAIMRQAGTPTLADITARASCPRRPEAALRAACAHV